MRNILYIVAVVMVIFWVIGFFVYTVGALIHILLVVALIFILIRIFSGNKTESKNK